MAKVFLDCGTHLGQGLRAISKLEGIDKTWRIYSWEPNPYTYEANLKKNKNKNLNVTYYNKAVSTYNGEIELMILRKKGKNYMGQGTTTLKVDDFANRERKQGQIHKQIKIPCIDFLQFIEKNTQSSDEIIIKLDIEGAEYTILEHLLPSNVANRIKKIYVEWHGYALHNKENYDVRQANIEQLSKQRNIEIINWH